MQHYTIIPCIAVLSYPALFYLFTSHAGKSKHRTFVQQQQKSAKHCHQKGFRRSIYHGRVTERLGLTQHVFTASAAAAETHQLSHRHAHRETQTHKRSLSAAGCMLADARCSDGWLQDQSIQLPADFAFSTSSLAVVRGRGLPPTCC